MKIRKRSFVKFGHFWKWRKREMDEKGWLRGHWESTYGNLVRVFPPDENWTMWHISIPCGKHPGESYDFAGKNARERAFAVAEAFTRQNRT